MNLFITVVVFIFGADALSESNPTVGEAVDILIEEDAGIYSERNPRKLFQKLKKGAAFAAGVKLGHYLAGKGLGLGSGSLATSNSFTLFGKSFSTALSVSYADSALPLPLHDPLENTSAPERAGDSLIHLAVLEVPSKETLKRLQALARISEDPRNITVALEETNDLTPPRQPTFLQEHNTRVKDFNSKMFGNKTRINSRF